MNTLAKNTSTFFFKNSLTLLFVFVSLAAFSQPCPPGNPAGDPSCIGADPSLPIDGGASLLIAAGVGLIGKKALQYKKRAKSDINE